MGASKVKLAVSNESSRDLLIEFKLSYVIKPAYSTDESVIECVSDGKVRGDTWRNESISIYKMPPGMSLSDIYLLGTDEMTLIKKFEHCIDVVSIIDESDSNASYKLIIADPMLN